MFYLQHNLSRIEVETLEQPMLLSEFDQLKLL